MSDEQSTDLVPVTFEGENRDGKKGLIIYWCPRSAVQWVTRKGVNEFTEGHASDTSEFVTWAFPDGQTWVSPNRRRRGDEVAINREQVEAWVGGGELSDDDFVRICTAIPNSSVPEAVGTIAAHL